MEFRRKKIILFSVIGFILMVLFTSFALRGAILHKAISAINARISGHHYISHWDGARFKGINTVYVKGIYFQSRDDENEVYINSVSLRVHILPLFIRKLRIKSLACKTITVRYKSLQPIARDMNPKPVDSAGIFDFIRVTDLAGRANMNIRRMFSYAPSKTLIDRLDIRITFAGNTTVIGLHNFRISHGELAAKLMLAGNNTLAEIPLTGKFNNSASVVEVHLANPNTGLLPLPLLRDKYGVATGFDTLNFRIDFSDRNRHLVNMAGNFSFAGFVLSGNRLSTTDIRIDRFNSSFLVHLGSHHVELDSITHVELNSIILRPYIRFDFDKGPGVVIRLLPVNWYAGDFFSSLPQGMFTSLPGLCAEGELHYFLDFSADLKDPDSLYFDTRLTAKQLKILSYGSDDYRLLNGTFQHHVYDNGSIVASFLVGPENPDFVPYEKISPFLRAAVMTSEDGTFFIHKGFNINAFRESIAANIRERRFARGGSTISMQLMKNIFLTRNKTIARKIEEALIVWLVENQHLVSKQRMYEIYLNIIEWGPGVYGIHQASRFYFDKTPGELNLTESIYLASIVPRPRWYKYTFGADGAVKPFFTGYFYRLKDLMVRKEFIAPADTIMSDAGIRLSGRAAQVFIATDTIEMDSVSVDDLEILQLL